MLMQIRSTKFNTSLSCNSHLQYAIAFMLLSMKLILKGTTRKWRMETTRSNIMKFAELKLFEVISSKKLVELIYLFTQIDSYHDYVLFSTKSQQKETHSTNALNKTNRLGHNFTSQIYTLFFFIKYILNFLNHKPQLLNFYSTKRTTFLLLFQSFNK